MEYFIATGIIVLALWLISDRSRVKDAKSSLQSLERGAQELQARTNEWAQRQNALRRLERGDSKSQAIQNHVRRRIEREEEKEHWFEENPGRRELFEAHRKELNNLLKSQSTDQPNEFPSIVVNQSAHLADPGSNAERQSTVELPDDILAWADEVHAQRRSEQARELEEWLVAKPGRREHYSRVIRELNID